MKYKFLKRANKILINSFGVCITKINNSYNYEDVLCSDFNMIRNSTLMVLVEEMKETNRGGAIAEVGVYKGSFAKKMNFLFPDKKIYLFDTFEGFNDKDIIYDNKVGFSDGKENFSDTNIDNVIKNMPNAEMCVVKKGYFPDSAANIEDVFCLVSLDADLWKPTYEGLIYFYPRMVQGGVIMIHDYLNRDYKGVKSAVRKYCVENCISYSIIADSAGSAIIVK